MAVLSLTENECKEKFNESRKSILQRYKAATKAALLGANFMSSSSIIVLQALVLHILSIRDAEDPLAVWTFTGAVIRVAEGMGMRIDGDLLGLSPFETEIRRRIWLQLWGHDFRAAELAGQSKVKAIEVDDNAPKPPANIDDKDIYPSMLHLPADSTRPTEMLFCMFKADLGTHARSMKAQLLKKGEGRFTSDELTAMDNLHMKDHFVQQMEEMLETKYIRYCDPSQPLHFFTLICARTATHMMRFLTHHPRRW